MMAGVSGVKEAREVVQVLGVSLTVDSYEGAIEWLLGSIRAGRKGRAHFCTVHSVVEASTNAQLRSALESAHATFMDGMPLVWVARIRGRRADRVCGPDVMLSMCDRGRAQNVRHYFMGGSSGTPERLAARLSQRFPGMTVAGTLSPPFHELTDVENADLIATINRASPDILWVGLGSPKQDLWAAKFATRLEAKLVMTVGAAFDFHSGNLVRAPRWMQRSGLEWLFRLAAEPKRLARRYIRTNSVFIWRLVVESARGRFTRRR